MDTKRLVTGIVIIFALIVGWQVFLAYLAKVNNWTLGPAPQESATTVPSTQSDANTLPAGQAATGTATTTATTQPTVTAANPPAGAWRVLPAASAQTQTTVTLGQTQLDVKDQSPYPLGIIINAEGAGFDHVVLNRFRDKVGSSEAYIYQQPEAIAPDQTRSLATRSVTINGQTLNLLDTDWALVSQNETSAVFALNLGNGEGKGPAVTLERHFGISPKTDENQGYEISADYKVINHTDQPLKISMAFNGPNAPSIDPMDRDDRQIISGYWNDGLVNVGQHMVYDFGKDMKQVSLLKNKEGQHLLWAGASSVYFDAIVRPLPLTGRLPEYLKQVEAIALNPDAESRQRQAAIAFQTNDLAVEAQGSLSVPMKVFLAPKKRALLNSDYYSQAPLGYNGTLGTMTSWCAFGWLVNGLVYLLMGFHFIFRDWGVAIIALVVLVRIILHPITRRSTISMQKMGKMGPEMERIKKKYGDNKDELNKAMMQMYKQQGVAPILGCLPMLLQMPIWIALWDMLRSTFELRQAPFLYGLTWIKDLTQPDQLFSFSQPIHILFFTVAGINLLPFLLAIAYFYQQKFTPKPLAATPEQERQQKMMQWMSLLFPIFLYAEPSGLNLYIAASTGVGVWEQRRIRAHIKRQEELEAQQRVIVDAKPTRARRMGSNDDATQPPAKPKGAFARWIAEMQQKAEQVKRDTQKRK